MAEVEILPPEGPLQPYAGPLIITDGPLGSSALVPHPNGAVTLIPMREGIHLGWIETPELGGVTLLFFAGQLADVGFAACGSREDLRGLIADLQSIDAQLGAG